MKNRKYTIQLNGKGIDAMIRGVGAYQKWLVRKSNELARRLAEMGVVNASIEFSRAFYVGNNDTQMSLERRGDGRYAVVAQGEAVLFIEFGAGLLAQQGGGHPEPHGFGAGTYPGKGHWDDPNGWYLPKDKWQADGTKHSYGNVPAMAMYNTVKELERELDRVVREVFASD